MALENYIIGASNAGAAGYHNAMAGMDQRRRDAEVDRHNAFNRQDVDRKDKDTKMREAFEMAALMDNDNGLNYLDRVSDELGVQRPDRNQIGAALETYRTRAGVSGASKSPVYVRRPDGSIGVMQLTESGRPVFPDLGGNEVLPGNLISVDRGGVKTLVNPRTGQPAATFEVGVSPDQQPSLKGEQQAAIEGAKTEAIPERAAVETKAAVDKARAERQAAAQSDLPKLADKANYAISVIDGLLNHPGLTKVVGAASLLPIVPGTEQAGADAYMKQIEGQAFLEAFETLKGGGQITQIEGEKATQAILRLSRKQSLEDFKSSMNELKDIVTKAKQRAEKSAGVSRETLAVGTVEDGYVYVGGDPADEQSWVKQR